LNIANAGINFYIEGKEYSTSDYDKKETKKNFIETTAKEFSEHLNCNISIYENEKEKLYQAKERSIYFFHIHLLIHKNNLYRLYPNKDSDENSVKKLEKALELEDNSLVKDRDREVNQYLLKVEIANSLSNEINKLKGKLNKEKEKEKKVIKEEYKVKLEEQAKEYAKQIEAYDKEIKRLIKIIKKEGLVIMYH